MIRLGFVVGDEMELIRRNIWFVSFSQRMSRCNWIRNFLDLDRNLFT